MVDVKSLVLPSLSDSGRIPIQFADHDLIQRTSPFICYFL
jgi:hypothetical protein